MEAVDNDISIEIIESERREYLKTLKPALQISLQILGDESVCMTLCNL